MLILCTLSDVRYIDNVILCGDHCFFFFQAEDGIRDLVRSRGLGDVYKRQHLQRAVDHVTTNKNT